jgi:hypothetical protein
MGDGRDSSDPDCLAENLDIPVFVPAPHPGPLPELRELPKSLRCWRGEGAGARTSDVRCSPYSRLPSPGSLQPQFCPGAVCLCVTVRVISIPRSG